jgi:hypothetical protein
MVIMGLIVQMSKFTKGQKVAYVWQIVQVEGNGVHNHMSKVEKMKDMHMDHTNGRLFGCHKEEELV